MTGEISNSAQELMRIEAQIDPSSLLSPPQTKDQLIDQAVALVLETSFMKEAEIEVGSPLPGESREEYVSRAEKIVIAKATKLIG